MIKFDWSQIERKSLYKSLYKISNQVIDKQLGIDKFHRIISKHTKSILPIRTRKDLDPSVATGNVYVGGSYYGFLDKKKSKSIEIRIHYCLFDNSVKLSRFKFARLCKTIADTVLHEIIHMRQYRRRNFKVLPGYYSTAEKTKQRNEQRYYGDTDEIGAYSFNIACELHDKFKGNNKKIASYLNANQNRLRGNNSWISYMRAFDYNHRHPIIRRVKKRVMYYISRNQVSKPFQSKDWISN